MAVIGAGVAGLTAAYVLQRAYHVTLYEAQDRLGGHAHTHDIPGAGGRALAPDSGFLVHNTRTYLFEFLDLVTAARHGRPQPSHRTALDGGLW